MRYIVFSLMIIVFLTGCSSSHKTPPIRLIDKLLVQDVSYVDEDTNDVYREHLIVEEIEHIYPIIISAVGDCTLGGYDKQLETKLSFHHVYERNQKDPGYFFQNVKDIFENDHLTIANLEGTLTTATKKPEKEFNFKGAPEYADILVAGGIDAVNIANNHIYDYYTVGYEDTKKNLADRDILYFGEGDAAIHEIKDARIGMLGYRAFSNPRAVKKVLEKEIEALKAQDVNIIIVSFHWGEEGKHEPNQIQKDLGRHAIDLGADLVLGHHPHVLQGIEQYKGRNIVYSLGNFCFGGNLNPRDKDTMIYQQVFQFSAMTGRIEAPLQYQIIPASISSTTEINNFQPTPLTGEDANRVMERIKRYTNRIN